MINEEIIKIEKFDIEKLKSLQLILENNRIINIKNELNDFDTMIVEYDSKSLEINKELKLKIKLIREKYYRKLFNVVDNIFKFKIPVKIDEPFFGPTKYGEIYEIVLNEYIDINRFKQKLKIALINYVGLYNFDNIFEFTKDEMLMLEEFRFNPNRQHINIFESYGMFCHKNDELLHVLEKSLDIDTLSEINKCNRFIIICPELIREYCIKQFDKYKSQGIIDESQMFSIIYNKVLTHELGHAVFDYVKDYENEKRANFFSSLTFDGVFDDFIKLFTEDQEEIYKNPILITKENTDKIKKDIYHI